MTFQLAPIFQSHMVLPKDKPIVLYGNGIENKIVKAKILGCQIETVIKNEKFELVFPLLNTNQPFHIVISSESEQVVLTDVVFGIVYLVAGQSNMAFTLSQALHGTEVIRSNQYPKMRYYHTPRLCFVGDHKENEPHGWTLCTQETVKNFSAVGYFFAEKLSKDLDEIIGIVDCSWGGSSIYCWSDSGSLSSIPKVDEEVKKIEKFIYVQEDKEYNQKIYEYDQSLLEYNKKITPYLKECENPIIFNSLVKQITYPWPPPMGKKSFLRPKCLYQYMFQEIVPFPYQGVIWYQGCSDAIRADVYEQLLIHMINRWRKDIGHDSISFYVVQLPMFDTTCDEGGDFCKIREAQYNVCSKLDQVHLVTAVDMGEKYNIHPVRKRELGYRLAQAAEYYDFMKSEDPRSPEVDTLVCKEESIELSFKYADYGLIALGGDVLGFEVEWLDGQATNISADILGNKIIIHLDQIDLDKAVAIRYGYQSFILVNLYNTFGLPVLPFRMMISVKRNE